MGVAFSGNLFTLYMFYELLSLSTYPLVTHHQDEEARASGRRYLVYLLGSSVGLVLPAMVWLYNRFGTLDFVPGGFVGRGVTGMEAWVVFLFLFGFAKAAVMPFHSWLPAAMVAPTPVSALLHAVAVVKAGAFSLVRVILYVFGGQFFETSWVTPVLYVFLSATILLGSFIALYQKELKRLLAFSTVAQLSYIVLGVSLFTEHGIKGGLLQLAMHAFGKITLFFGAGAIFVATGKKLIHEMEGLGRSMPFTFGAFFLGALSIIGLPPMGGFLSKWNLALGAYEGGHLALLGVLLLSSLLNVAYFMPIVYRAYFASKPLPWDIKEAPLWCLIPQIITAIISLWLFLWPAPLAQLTELFVRRI
jgi:multicomponent Na+:H+ antiporter subunit D